MKVLKEEQKEEEKKRKQVEKEVEELKQMILLMREKSEGKKIEGIIQEEKVEVKLPEEVEVVYKDDFDREIRHF